MFALDCVTSDSPLLLSGAVSDTKPTPAIKMMPQIMDTSSGMPFRCLVMASNMASAAARKISVLRTPFRNDILAREHDRRAMKSNANANRRDSAGVKAVVRAPVSRASTKDKPPRKRSIEVELILFAPGTERLIRGATIVLATSVFLS